MRDTNIQDEEILLNVRNIQRRKSSIFVNSFKSDASDDSDELNDRDVPPASEGHRSPGTNPNPGHRFRAAGNAARAVVRARAASQISLGASGELQIADHNDLDFLLTRLNTAIEREDGHFDEEGRQADGLRVPILDFHRHVRPSFLAAVGNDSERGGIDGIRESEGERKVRIRIEQIDASFRDLFEAFRWVREIFGPLEISNVPHDVGKELLLYPDRIFVHKDELSSFLRSADERAISLATLQRLLETLFFESKRDYMTIANLKQILKEDMDSAIKSLEATEVVSGGAMAKGGAGASKKASADGGGTPDASPKKRVVVARRDSQNGPSLILNHGAKHLKATTMEVCRVKVLFDRFSDGLDCITRVQWEGFVRQAYPALVSKAVTMWRNLEERADGEPVTLLLVLTVMYPASNKLEMQEMIANLARHAPSGLIDKPLWDDLCEPFADADKLEGGGAISTQVLMQRLQDTGRYPSKSVIQFIGRSISNGSSAISWRDAERWFKTVRYANYTVVAFAKLNEMMEIAKASRG